MKLRRCVGFLSLLLALSIQAADPLSQWTTRNQADPDQLNLLRSASLSDVAYGAGRFVAVGRSVLQSTDGRRWAEVASPANAPLRQIKFDAGEFVAVGESGTILVSSDGLNWDRATSPVQQDLQACAYGNGTWLAISGSGAALTSTNGRNWTAHAIPLTAETSGISDVTYGNGIFAVPAGSALFTSVNGAAWSEATVAHPWSVRLGSKIAFGDGKFVVGASKVADRLGTLFELFVSTNAVEWTSTLLASQESVTRVNYQDGLWTVLSLYGDNYPTIRFSADGVQWTSSVLEPALASMTGLARGPTLSVAVGAWGMEPVLISYDRRTWFPPGSAFSKSPALSVTRGPGAFVVLTGSGAVLRSDDGRLWTAHYASTRAALSDVAFGNGVYVAVGAAGLIMASPDGRTWQESNAGTTESFADVAFANGVFVAATSKGSILHSTDGRRWTTDRQGKAFYGATIAAGEGRPFTVFFTDCASSQQCTDVPFTSSDGQAWTEQAPRPTRFMNGIAFGASVFVAGGSGGVVGQAPLAYSTNAVDWIPCQPAAGLNGVNYRVIFAGDRFVAVETLSAAIWDSFDGIAWVPHGQISNRPQGQIVQGIAYGLGTVLAISSTGTLPGSFSFIAQSSAFQDEAPRLGLVDGEGRRGLAVTGVVGRIYRIEAADRLDQASWRAVETFTSEASPTLRFDAAAPPGEQFYRAVLLPSSP